jgi:hypothetical protein
MQHTKLPNEDGWYWVHLFDTHGSDAWYMAYLYVEDVHRVHLKLIDVDTDFFGVEHIALDADGQSEYGHVKQWIGPIQCPAGEAEEV